MRARIGRYADSVVVQALALALMSRVVLFFVNWYSIKAMPYEWPGYGSWAETTYMIGGWMQWDAGHYYRIVANGYSVAESSSHGVPAFFPAYPMIIDGILKVLGAQPTWHNVGVIGMAVSHLCFLVAIPLLTWLVARLRGDDVARITALLLVTSPFSLFFSSVYTESMFLLLVVLTFVLALRGSWGLAAIVVAVATATRVTGLALVPALLLMAWRRGLPLPRLVLLAIISPLGLISFMAYTGVVLDDPLAFLRAQEAWGGWYERGGQYLETFLTNPMAILQGDPTNAIVLLNVMLAALAVVCMPWIWRNLDPGVALFTTLVILQGATSWVSLGRYMLPALGVYIALATFMARPGWPSVTRQIVVTASTLLLGMFTVLFAHGRWVN